MKQLFFLTLFVAAISSPLSLQAQGIFIGHGIEVNGGLPGDYGVKGYNARLGYIQNRIGAGINYGNSNANGYLAQHYGMDVYLYGIDTRFFDWNIFGDFRLRKIGGELANEPITGDGITFQFGTNAIGTLPIAKFLSIKGLAGFGYQRFRDKVTQGGLQRITTTGMSYFTLGAGLMLKIQRLHIGVLPQGYLRGRTWTFMPAATVAWSLSERKEKR